MAKVLNRRADMPDAVPSRLMVWYVAVRPFAYTASALPVLFGTVLAWSAGYRFRPVVFGVLLTGVLLLHTAGNLLNDGCDFLRGFDREAGPCSGAVVRGWISPRQARHAAYGCLAAGVGCGLTLAWLAGPVVILAGVIGLAAAAGYTRLGRCFKTAGWGDPVVAVAFGLLPVCTAWWVQTGLEAWQPVFWSIPFAMLAVAILHANNWRDVMADRAHGCLTVAGRLRPATALVYYRVLTLTPFVLVVWYVLLERISALPVRAPVTGLMALAALPAAVRLGRDAGKPAASGLSMLDASTARLHLGFGLLLIGGFLVDMAFCTV